MKLVIRHRRWRWIVRWRSTGNQQKWQMNAGLFVVGDPTPEILLAFASNLRKLADEAEEMAKEVKP